MQKKKELEQRKKELEKNNKKKLQEFKEEYPNINIHNYKELDIFIDISRRISSIVIDELQVDERLIALEYNIPLYFTWNYLSSDSNNEDENLNFCRFVMAIEEEFDMEIPDEEAERFDGCSIDWLTNFIIQKLD